ncbi:hypothetical protein SLS56_010772 [Neofusicoccum ribis]|uniref:Glycosyltransferase family 2 protein n=1 Tax=Neofusicoccum ribis TaxID=45134 RepID=A0ABR3SDG6_9PEZI
MESNGPSAPGDVAEDVVLQDVVLPASLLRVPLTRRNPEHTRWSSIAGSRPVQGIPHSEAIADRRRASSIATGAINRPQQDQQPRKRSIPAITEQQPPSFSGNASFGSSEKPAQNHGKPRPISSVPPDEQVTFAVPDGGQKRISFHPKFNDYSFGASSSITKSTTKDSHRISFREAVQADGIDQSEKQGPPAVPPTIQQRARNVRNSIRRSSVWDLYQNAKGRGAALQRQRWAQLLFEYTMYTLALAFVYFVFVGVPLWKGSVYWLYWVVSHKFVVPWTFSITIGIATVYAFLPLLIFFEKEPPARHGIYIKDIPGVKDTALLIPCYKSASLIANTLDAALKTFPPSHIFVIANGNSQTPLDNTEEVCRPYGVNHVWCPVGSKIVAQFVGSFAAKEFKNVLLIDDDCALPPNFPVVAERLTERVKCIGYTIKSVGPDSSKGSFCQQAQDLEYKLSGLQRAFAGKVGSATFPHGAISLWDRDFFIRTFHDHPGFSVSEDWFFGDSCRSLGGRIVMCTSIFVETETPSAIFWNRKGGSRGGFGEMTVFKQRFMRWNFFFVAGIWYNMAYIFSSWKLGWWEIGAKLFVFQEVYESLLYLLAPFMLPISFIVRPAFCGYLLAATVVIYFVNVLIFNEIHLRLRKQRVSWTVLLFYYIPYKCALTLVNVVSCYWSIFKYARYFAKRHLKITEDENAVKVVLRLEETESCSVSHGASFSYEGGGRRMTVVTVAA